MTTMLATTPAGATMVPVASTAISVVTPVALDALLALDAGWALDGGYTVGLGSMAVRTVTGWLAGTYDAVLAYDGGYPYDTPAAISTAVTIAGTVPASASMTPTSPVLTFPGLYDTAVTYDAGHPYDTPATFQYPATMTSN